MGDVLTHYESLLARHYSRCMGGFDAMSQASADFFASHDLRPRLSGRAVDLGAGSGFQTVPLARAGFAVTAVDFSPTLLGELRTRAAGLDVTTVQGDMTDVEALLPRPVELAVCMGDTIAHLASVAAVEAFLAGVAGVLEQGGTLVLSFRDQERELVGTDRFLQLYADDTLISTCFLEYGEQSIEVTDLAQIRTETGWVLEKSAYQKVRLRRQEVLDLLVRAGYAIVFEETRRGLVSVIARKG